MLRNLHHRFCANLTFNCVTHSTEHLFIATDNGFTAFDIETLDGYTFENNESTTTVAVDFSSWKNVFMSCSGSGTVSLWDLKTRHGLVVASIPDSHRALCGVKFISGSVSVDGRYLSCGSECMQECRPKKCRKLEDTPSAYVVIWDSRRLDHPLNVLDDIHSDSVNHLSFNTTEPDLLLTGSDDGLVNVCNLTYPADDCLSEVFNVESPVNLCGWTDPRSSSTGNCVSSPAIYSLSNMQTQFKVWPLLCDNEDIIEEWKKITKNYSGKRILTAGLIPLRSSECNKVKSNSPSFCLLSTTNSKGNLRVSEVHARGSSLLCTDTLICSGSKTMVDDFDGDIFFASFLQHSVQDPVNIIAVSRRSIHHLLLNLSPDENTS